MGRFEEPLFNFFIQALAIYQESRISFAQDGKVLAGAISILCHGFSRARKKVRVDRLTIVTRQQQTLEKRQQDWSNAMI